MIIVSTSIFPQHLRETKCEKQPKIPILELLENVRSKQVFSKREPNQPNPSTLTQRMQVPHKHKIYWTGCRTHFVCAYLISPAAWTVFLRKKKTLKSASKIRRRIEREKAPRRHSKEQRDNQLVGFRCGSAAFSWCPPLGGLLASWNDKR